MADDSLTEVLDRVTGNKMGDATICICNEDRIEDGSANPFAEGPAGGQVRSPLFRLLFVCARF